MIEDLEDRAAYALHDELQHDGPARFCEICQKAVQVILDLVDADQQEDPETFYEEGYKQGHEDGITEGREQGRKAAEKEVKDRVST